MSAIFTTNAMIMGPAKMMDLASVMLDFLATTVPVNSKRTFIIENVGALPGFLILLTKALTNVSKNYYTFLRIIFLVPNSLVKQLLVVEKSGAN